MLISFTEKMPGKNCAARYCKNTTATGGLVVGLSYHRFPVKDTDRYEANLSVHPFVILFVYQLMTG